MFIHFVTSENITMQVPRSLFWGGSHVVHYSSLNVVTAQQKHRPTCIIIPACTVKQQVTQKVTDQNGHCSDKWPTKLPALFCTLVVTMDRVMIKTLNYVDQRRLTLGSDSWLLAQQQRAQTCKTVFRNDMLFCVAPSTVTLCHAPVVSTFVFSLQSLHCLYSSSLIF